MWWLIAAMLLGFLVVHLAKMMRLYLVLMEHKIGFLRFVRLYLRTTLVNLIVPFKLGEVYRIFCISRETKVWQVGILCVVVDRFFDTVALFLVLLPFDIFIGKNLSIITGVFFVVIALIWIVYLSIPPTYAYLNKYIIKHKRSRRAMLTLKGLDIVKQWYDYTRELVKGRFALIILASFVGWLTEVGVLKALAEFLKVSFGPGDFSAYIQTIFLAGSSELAVRYTLYSMVGIAVITVITYLAYLIGKLMGKEPDGSRK